MIDAVNANLFQTLADMLGRILLMNQGRISVQIDFSDQKGGLDGA
jgi:hypothetical protein